MQRSALVQEVETMDFLDKINISKMKHYDNRSEAPLGALLQVLESGGRAVGMRTEFPNGPTTLDAALLVLTGARLGTLLVGEEVSGPAIDVSALIEIVACDAAPTFRTRGLPMTGGMLLGPTARSGTYFVWAVRTAAPGSLQEDLGAVCVRDDQKSSAKTKFILIRALPEFVILTSNITVDRIDRTPLGGTRGP
jgi:hypothetical protein